jgi:hypothetical protein
MFMILLFNYTSNMMSGNRQPVEERPLLASNKLVQALDFSGIELQRIGTGWRVLSQIPNLNIPQPHTFIDVWTQQPLESLSSEPMLLEGSVNLPVVAWLAGEAEGNVFEFVINKQNQSVYIHDKFSDQWFALPYSQLGAFIPEILLNA